MFTEFILPRRTELYTSVLCAMLVSCTSCSHEGAGGYLIDEIGDANRIATWGLDQKDDDRIGDAIAALLEVAMTARPAEAERAIVGVKQIHDKLLEGWPGYTGISRYRSEDRSGPIPEPRRAANLEWQIHLLYDRLLTYYSSDRSVALYFRIEPDPVRFPSANKTWLEEGERYGLHPANNHGRKRIPDV